MWRRMSRGHSGLEQQRLVVRVARNMHFDKLFTSIGTDSYAEVALMSSAYKCPQ
jgi:hypothetical protein